MVARLPEKNWFTVDEAAQLLSISPLTAYRWVRLGRLTAKNIAMPNKRKPTYRIGRDTLVSAMDQQRQGLPVSV